MIERNKAKHTILENIHHKCPNEAPTREEVLAPKDPGIGAATHGDGKTPCRLSAT